MLVASRPATAAMVLGDDRQEEIRIFLIPSHAFLPQWCLAMTAKKSYKFANGYGASVIQPQWCLAMTAKKSRVPLDGGHPRDAAMVLGDDRQEEISPRASGESSGSRPQWCLAMTAKKSAHAAWDIDVVAAAMVLGDDRQEERLSIRRERMGERAAMVLGDDRQEEGSRKS